MYCHTRANLYHTVYKYQAYQKTKKNIYGTTKKRTHSTIEWKLHRMIRWKFECLVYRKRTNLLQYKISCKDCIISVVCDVMCVFPAHRRFVRASGQCSHMNRTLSVFGVSYNILPRSHNKCRAILPTNKISSFFCCYLYNCEYASALPHTYAMKIERQKKPTAQMVEKVKRKQKINRNIFGIEF